MHKWLSSGPHLAPKNSTNLCASLNMEIHVFNDKCLEFEISTLNGITGFPFGIDIIFIDGQSP